MTASGMTIDLIDLLAVLPGVVAEMFRMWKGSKP